MAWRTPAHWARGHRADPAPGRDRPPTLPTRTALERRWVVVAAAAGMFGLLFGVRQTSARPDDTLALLYVIPIALIALEFGLRGGLGAALLSFALLEVWMASSHADLDFVGVATRVTAFVLVGAIAGHFSDRMRDGNARQQRLVRSGLELSHLSATADPAAMLAAEAMRVVPASVVKVALPGGAAAHRGDSAAACEEAIPIALRGEELATMVVGSRRRLTGDDRAALEIFALQAALAAENRRLLEHERERVLILAELHDARARLIERGDQLQAVVARQEAERGELARELHDEAAQVLAAVLLDLKGLERQLGQEPGGERWATVRGNVGATLQSLRSLAVSLRPPILRLGLQAALDELADAAREQGFGRVALNLDGTAELGPELETVIYRIIEEVITAAGPSRELELVSDAAAGTLVVVVRDSEHEIDGERLTILSARLELAGGTVSPDDHGLRVVVPLSARAAS